MAVWMKMKRAIVLVLVLVASARLMLIECYVLRDYTWEEA